MTTPLRRYWLQALLGVCGLVTIALLAWPAGSETASGAAAAPRYAGPVFAARKAGAPLGFPLQLTTANALSTASTAAEPLPVLVGLAAGQAYLRSAATGEVERVRRGQSVDGWQVVAVGARSVTVRGSSGDERLDLFKPTPPAAAAEAVPPGGVPAVAGPPPVGP